MYKNKKILALLLPVLIIGGVLLYVRVTKDEPQSVDTATTTSKLKTAQAAFGQGEKRPTGSGTGNQGGAIDQKGIPPSESSSTGSPVSSESGAITLTQPTDGNSLTDGSIIYGSSSLSSVQYRLVDSETGVLAQGSLTVVDGKFSGKLQFKPQSSFGKLSLFSFDTSTGAEVNRLTVKIKF